jgi:uncharacterized membrane protein YkvI
MTSNGNSEEWLSLDTRLITAAGVVALFGALLLGIAALMGSNALLTAVREWVNQQEVPPSETAKSMIKQFHDAALASTSAATDAWRTTIAPSSD